MARKLKGTAIQAGTISVTQLDNSVSTVIQTGGGPKITAVQVTDASWAVLDDTAVDTAGGNILITGTGFVSGCLVYIGQTPANSVGFVSSTQVRVNIPALTAGTYPVYLSNPDGGTAIRLPGVTTSANPAWQTASALPEQYDGVAITLNLVATEATSYTLTSGTLPPGLSLNTSTGAITGTVTGVTVDTTYTFTVRATDPQNQDSPRTFTVTITVSDAYFKLTTLLLSGSALSANTVIRDSSTNNFNLTVSGDARANNFTPYGTGWSTYFSSTSGITVSGLTPIGSGDLTIETFVYMTTLSGEQHMVQQGTSTTNLLLSYDGTSQRLRFLVRNDAGSSNLDINSPNAPVINQWFHFAGTVQGTTGRMWINGNVVTTGTVSGTRSGSQTFVYIGDNGSGGSRPLTGYLSNTRIVVGTAVYTANFSPTTTNLSSVSGTSLLTNQSNRFINLVGNVAATISQGSPRITSFNPFNITNTGVNGSMYFDGSGDYLTVPSNAVFAFGTGDFTIEFWLYPTTVATTQRNITFPTTNAPIVYINGSRQLVLENYGIAAIATTTNTVDLNAWNHCVATRQSGTLKLFINGVQGVSVANSTNWVQSAVNIGTDAGTNFTNGYITDVRILKGTGYSTIIVPTSALTAITNTQLLTLQYDQPHNNHTFLDSSSNQFLITRNGNASQGTFSPFSQSGHSVYFDGNGDYLAIADNAALRLGTGDFTIEFYINVGPVGTHKDQAGGVDNYPRVITKGLFGSTTGIDIGYDSTGGKSIYWSDKIGTDAVEPNTWYHVAFTRSGTTWRVFKDGILKGSNTFVGYDISDTREVNIARLGYSNGVGFNHMNCYISNLRIVKGTALYTTNFTPSTTPLTSVANTSLLACHANRFIDGSTNNFTVTRNGDTRITAFGPFSTTVYSPVIHGGSAYVNATSTYLALPASTPLVNISDWTVDFWMYPTSYINAQGIFGASNGGGASLKIAFQINGSSISLYKTGTAIISISQPPLNQWTHLSIVRSSSTGLAYIFVNGVLGTSGSFGSEAVTSNFQLFTNGEGATSGMYGYLSSFRVSNIARQITAFTVPTQPYQADTNTILLTNFTDSAILDSTGRNVLETVADAKTSSVVTKFTGGSMYFDGTGDYIIMPDVLTGQFGTGDFTVEYWDRHGSQGTNYAPQVGTLSSGTGSGSWRFGTFSNLAGVYLAYHNGTSFIDVVFGSTVYNDNIWRHFALSRQGTTVRAFVDGVQVGSNQTVSQNFNSSNRVILGAELTSPTYFTGYIADLRITRGYARYTANFTAPTAPARLK